MKLENTYVEQDVSAVLTRTDRKEVMFVLATADGHPIHCDFEDERAAPTTMAPESAATTQRVTNWFLDHYGSQLAKLSSRLQSLSKDKKLTWQISQTRSVSDPESLLYVAFWKFTPKR